MMRFLLKKTVVLLVVAGVLLVTGAGVLWWDANVQAQDASTLHPTFVLLDASGQPVITSGQAVSSMQTCGSCHDTAFIANHSGHADAGLQSQVAAGQVEDARAWDTSTGVFGKWDPLTYRYLSSADDERIDLTTASWIQVYGIRHVGGGPAMTTADGTALAESSDPLVTQVVDPVSGELVNWDWEESGTVEMNCFLCHTANPDNAARADALQSGQFGWAGTATLAASGLVSKTDAGWIWNPDAFAADGTLVAGALPIQDPSDSNCALCHGVAHADAQIPLVYDLFDATQRTTYMTGQVFSPQRIANSGTNVADKETLARSWDIHAERAVNCIDCHYSLNNPVFFVTSDDSRPAHLEFDPRRMDFGDYLQRPLHEFANTDNAVSMFGGSGRTCADCHDAESTHAWLPYTERHINALECESCHIPQLYSPALQSVDWTVLKTDSTPVLDYRGLDGDLVTGYQPVLLAVGSEDSVKLAPFNLVTAWYWVVGEPARPVALRDLQAAWLDGDHYHAEILTVFDSDGDGLLSEGELLLDQEAKITLIAAQLSALGLENPRIVGDIQPYAISHGVTSGEYATRECTTCHTDDSRVNATLVLSGHTPAGADPTFVGLNQAHFTGTLSRDDAGNLFFLPESSMPPAELYVIGHDSVSWIDWFGILMFLGVLAGVSAHGGLRYLAARRMVGHGHNAAIREVYMYSVYERLWHWLQTTAIFGLLLTGLIIHKPQMFGMFSFSYIVLVHNALALLLVVNAALSLFYHLVSGEIRQYLPRPYGFFDQAIEQAKFYLLGIFKGADHPFEKTPQRKLNPLQQVTYFMILNVLLPLQVITGALMWGAQQLPDLTAQLGGLGFLAPFHTLVAWTFASFIVGHVYLTTTGHTPLANIKAMMIGWDEVETHADHGEQQTGEMKA